MVECPPDGPDGQPVSIVGLDSSIIQNLECGKHRVTWAASTTPWWTAVNPKPVPRTLSLGRKGDSTGQILPSSAATILPEQSAEEVGEVRESELSDEELDVCGIESMTPAELAITVGPMPKKRAH